MSGILVAIAPLGQSSGSSNALTVSASSYTANVTAPSGTGIPVNVVITNPPSGVTLASFSLEALSGGSKIVQYDSDASASQSCIFYFRWSGLLVGEQVTNTYQVNVVRGPYDPGSAVFSVTLTRTS
ncbi:MULTISPECIES: hypothetical protein [unclassified Sphingomonas]|uniref:hypothetical protein n=1 Tax=unclassified Sphingomonas TaxID=196159 RepID=UPI0012E3ACC9|nr:MULTISPECIES: hypothetical protein [unclassified Sphingomonas]